MPVVIPPESPEPFSDLTPEIRVQRKNTHRFIMADPIALALVPKTEVQLASGGVSTADGDPRQVQTFRLIPMSHAERPRRSVAGAGSTSAGQQRRHDFTLLGEWDALVESGDWWTDERGERWIVDEMVPHNGYETRGLVTSYGKTR